MEKYSGLWTLSIEALWGLVSGHTAGKFSGSGPEQIASSSVFKILMKACLDSAQMVVLVFFSDKFQNSQYPTYGFRNYLVFIENKYLVLCGTKIWLEIEC